MSRVSDLRARLESIGPSDGITRDELEQMDLAQALRELPELRKVDAAVSSFIDAMYAAEVAANEATESIQEALSRLDAALKREPWGDFVVNARLEDAEPNLLDVLRAAERFENEIRYLFRAVSSD
jgi:hypothetical protein